VVVAVHLHRLEDRHVIRLWHRHQGGRFVFSEHLRRASLDRAMNSQPGRDGAPRHRPGLPVGQVDELVAGEGRVVPLSPEPLRAYHQMGVWRFDVFREPRDGDMWIYRRDERIRLPYAQIIRHSSDGIPYLSPGIVLRFKAKSDVDTDRVDFEGTVPLLTADERRWLNDALGIVHPHHAWRERLR
jgi:hypothetical protein